MNQIHKGRASSYGDARDMEAYQRALLAFLRAGYSQRHAEVAARKVGDPGIGWMDNDLANIAIPWVALPVEDWLEKWRSKSKAHRKAVLVTIGGKTVRCLLGDTMPHKFHIRNGAIIDLAPGAQHAFGLVPPFLVACSWQWED